MESFKCIVCGSRFDWDKRKHAYGKPPKTCSKRCSGVYSTNNRSEETKRKMSEGRRGVNNPHWKEDVGYSGLHLWVRDNYPKPDNCELCHLDQPLDLANKSGRYLRDISDWEWLCRKCHMVKDGRLEKFVALKRPPQKKGELSPFWRGGEEHYKEYRREYYKRHKN